MSSVIPSDSAAPIRSDSVRIPELLAPAGDWDCAKAAVENGADAIYFGLDRFNARMRARNFSASDLPSLMRFLHLRGVKGYVTLNTLVFENELEEAEQYLRTMIASGVDAVIVQDVGICRLIRKLSPDFPIHASTQMTVTSAGGVEFARELGCNLVVLARECSIREIQKIQESLAQRDALASTMPLEVFVHGALCVAYSGQCLTSEALGGRSANRGECAQACRMPYELLSDGNTVPLGDRKYLLSPQDLAGMDVLPELVRTGVASLKIEGRLKSPEYVANITRLYRNALDRLGGGSMLSKVPVQVNQPTNDDAAKYRMEMAFSRGLFTGWFGGINNQQLVHARFGKKRGVLVGEVRHVLDDGVVLTILAPLKPGDGVVFDAGHPEEDEEGGRIYEIEPIARSRDGEHVLRFGRGDVDFKRIHPGDKIWKTNDPELDRQLRQTFEGDNPKFQRAVSMEVHGAPGTLLTLIVQDEHGLIAKQESSMPLVTAEKHPLSDDRLRQQLGRLGGTPFRLAELRNYLQGEVMLPMSELNRLRRDSITELARLRSEPARWTLNQSASPEPTRTSATTAAAPSELIVLVRNLAQLEAALKCGVNILYCDFENPRKYRDAVQIVHCSTGCSSPKREIWVAPPRIFKSGEEWTLNQIRSCNADGYLARNYDHLTFFAGDRRIGDFSLNIANHLSAEHFRTRFGLERLTASYDLNFAQLESLLQSAPAEWFEVTVHQHIPMFHMEHCVFCAFLSSGTDYTNCGRPCDSHDVKIRDRVGAEHPVKADVGCRNTVFNSLAQTGAEFMSRMQALGVRHFRLEFLNETPSQVMETVAKYRQLLRGEISGTQLWRELKLLSQLGVTRGQMAGPKS